MYTCINYNYIGLFLFRVGISQFFLLQLALALADIALQMQGWETVVDDVIRT